MSKEKRKKPRFRAKRQNANVVVYSIDQAMALYQAGSLDQAEAVCGTIVQADPNSFDASHLLAVIQFQRGHYTEALNCYDQALALRPDTAEVLSNRGVLLREMGRFEDALRSYEHSLALDPENSAAHNNRGVVLRDLNRLEDALLSYDKALSIRPNYLEAINNRAVILHEMGQLENALAAIGEALGSKPNYKDALYNQGNILRDMKRFEDALVSYNKTLELEPNYHAALFNRGNVLRELGRFGEALSSYDEVLKKIPDDIDALYNRGLTLQALRRFQEAIDCYERILKVKPDHKYALDGLAGSVLTICDWNKTAQIDSQLRDDILQLRSIISPFTLLGYSADPLLQLKCSQNFIADHIPTLPPPVRVSPYNFRDRIRIAYISADFREHPIAQLMARLFEGHDRSQFEVVGISLKLDDGSHMRRRIVKSFDSFYDVQTRTDREIAYLLSDLKVDIAIDLMGYTKDARPGIFANRPAPIQVSYLGYPGTMGSKFMDYIIADPLVIPLDQQLFYSERVVYLPETYLPPGCYITIDPRLKIDGRAKRREAGLPDSGFVFCCFNNNYKITATVFDVWMQLLRKISGSVLWLLRDNVDAEANLLTEAAARGVDPDRLVFGGRLSFEDHLARYPLADLFLDTLPYNAHSTGSEALWAGVPVLTCTGNTFQGRVGTSLLHALGLQELVTSSLEEYQSLATKLANDAFLLESIRQKLERNRSSYPLFNADHFRANIEAAYLLMCRRQKTRQ
jgi:protein O-GlcNAc transferase